MAHIPVFKLGVLLVKQATKPMARAVKSRAMASENLSKLCEFLGQTWHIQTTKLNLRVQGHKVKEVKRLNEQEAVQSGAELLAEGFVLTVGIAALMAEAKRSAISAAEKAAHKAMRRQQKMEAMQHLNDTIKAVATYSSEMRKAIREHEKVRIECEQAKKPVPPILLPQMPPLMLEMIGEKESPTDLVVAAHAKDSEKKSGWGANVLYKVTIDSASGLIRWVGSVVNGEDDDGDDDGGSDDEE